MKVRFVKSGSSRIVSRSKAGVAGSAILMSSSRASSPLNDNKMRDPSRSLWCNALLAASEEGDDAMMG
jgi:hypothetical protein